MRKITKKERSELNRHIHLAAQSFASQVSGFAIEQGRVPMVARLAWEGESLQVVVEQAPAAVQAAPVDEFEPY